MRRLSSAVDDINAQYGKHTVHLAVSHAANSRAGHIRNEPAWRKQELLAGETFRRRLNIPLLKLR
jgi:hypothetical protein